MGNSEVGHLTIGSGRVLFQDLMRVNVRRRATARSSTNPALVGAFARARERGGAVHLLGPRLAGRRPLPHRAPARAARARAAAGDGGAHVDPRVHRRPRRLAARRGGRPRAAAGGRDRDRRRPLLRHGPRQPRRAHRARGRRDPRRRRRAARPIPSKLCERATRAGSPTSSSSRSCWPAARASLLRPTRRFSSTSAPTAAGSSRGGCWRAAST